MEEKLLSLEAAVSKIIGNGDVVAIGGVGRNRSPMALVREIIRQGKRNLHIVGREKGMDFDMLIGAGCVKKVSFAMVSLEEFGLAMNFRRKTEKGEIELDEHACDSVITSIRAASMGLTFLPVRGMLESDVFKVSKSMQEIQCPFTGERLAAVKAIKPDVTIIHAHQADKYGNVRLQGSPFEDILKACAAERTIVTVEEIIDNEEIRAHPHLTSIPYIYITAVVHQEKGAWPCSCDHYYESDDQNIKEYSKAIKTPEGFQGYLEEYVLNRRD